ncbi:MAG TPA: hypothetical protein DEV81_22355 [Cyanobacteria bacterium UBA11049]|nr:hypothetical protein [Cyanobacteria bacterium UBA11049]
MYRFQLLPVKQTDCHKNFWEWLLYQQHQFRLDELHLTTVNSQSFKLCSLALPVQRLSCTDSVSFG